MIQSFANKYNKHIAYTMFVVFYLQTIVMPLHAAVRVNEPVWHGYQLAKYSSSSNAAKKNISKSSKEEDFAKPTLPAEESVESKKMSTINKAKDFKSLLQQADVAKVTNEAPNKTNIGGPSAPEASSFKPVGSNNLVNLFTGDFSYSIPLLDVGGYPVNLFYTGGIGMEQEASWVGLGWNINPGSVSRSMRGIPDDFNGEDKLEQTQKVKPNRTWGGEVGVDGEVIGLKVPKMNFSLGVSYNNYLGPAFELGAGVSLSMPITKNVGTEKTVKDTIGSASLKLDAKYSSRGGLTLSPSLNASLPLKNGRDNIGAGLSTSYNSRTGIKEINFSINSSSSSITRRDKEELKSNDKGRNISGSLGSVSITFARPSYVPVLRMPMQYKNYSGQLELGGGMFGLRGAAHGQGYYSESKVPAESEIVYKPLVGFMYSEKANGNKDAVMDIQRLNDAEVTPNTPILSAPMYNYDVFNIQGEGTGSSIRAYRGDLGFMRDNETGSKDENISIGGDIAPAGHYGVNWNVIKTPTRSGGWDDDNNTLRTTMAFKGKLATDANNDVKFENIYFRSPGEATVTNPELLDRIGGDKLVRFKLSQGTINPRLETSLQQFEKKSPLNFKGDLTLDANKISLQEREKRTQVTTMLTAKEASEVGLEKKIRNYAMGSGIINGSNNVNYDSIDRIDPTGRIRKAHHISEINVLEQSGMRYVYGVPVYNTIQKEYTFSIDKAGNPNTGIALFDADEKGRDSRHMENSSKLDGYLMTQETPAYASSFLLSGLLSPDYVDVTGNGVTEDDLGSAVKFDYTKSADNHKWRTPRSQLNTPGNTAHFNDGLKSIRKDNKATISYGEREVWYLGAIESKAMVAIFYTSYRKDAKGVYSDIDGRVNGGENANKKLDSIRLFTKAEIKAKGINAAIPIKTVNFTYNYSLCKGTPDNAVGGVDGGKLTLEKVFFTYYGRTRANKDKYIFNYQYSPATTATDNPDYAYQASDKWGTYKPPATNPSGLTNPDFPYTSTNKTANDAYAGAWALKRILLPSGGQMEVQYEADDYGYVQNRKACDMFKIYGLGDSKNAGQWNEMYKKAFFGTALLSTDYEYVYVQIPSPLQSINPAAQKQEILEKYLLGLGDDEQLAFKLNLEVPKGVENITVYAKYDDYGLCTNSPNRDLIYFKVRRVDNKSPLSRAAIGFLTESLSGQAFPNSELEVNSVKDFLGVIVQMLVDIKNAFSGVDNQMRSQGLAKDIELAKSFVRLADPDRIKYGGGTRVKKVIVKDNWNRMTKQYGATYGQEYDYTTTDQILGKDVTISSGVASYEPGLGSEENPFREAIAYSDKVPLSTAQYGAIEMPMLDGLYPSPGVGYSKVTVRSINRNATLVDTSKRLRSAIGKQVTEYFTAKDYPTFSSFTTMDSREYHFNSFFNIFYKELKDRKTTSQGFLVETNDMHGKMKAQIAYSESDEKTPLSYSYHSYKNTGKNGLNDKVNFVNNATGGTVTQGNMGIDMELMTDVREFKVESNGKNGQLQTDFFTFVPFPILALPKLFLKTVTENRYRSVTCTKLINYHAIEDSVIVMDKGSIVSTKTIAYDAETGTAIVTKTANEFKDAIYNVSYPAHWAYSGVGLAYKNIDREFKGVAFDNGKIVLPLSTQNEAFESGDELYLIDRGTGKGASCVEETPSAIKLWAYDKNKTNTALTVPSKDLVFIDEKGTLYTKGNVHCRIIRSGKRNNLGLTVSGATCMEDPTRTGKLVINNADKIVTANAVEYKEKWQVDNEMIKRYSDVIIPANCLIITSEDCNGYFEKSINPYIKGLIGNFKPHRSYTYYGERTEMNTTNQTAIRKNGYLNNFVNYWNFNPAYNLVPDVLNTKWVWNSELTKVNSKGQELETKNALNIYTAAQYGFAKNQTTAVANNSRVNEMFAESFEDSNYGEAINTGNYINSCTKKQINLGSFTNANSLGFNAHTGKNVMKVNPNSNSTANIPLNKNLDEYNLNLGEDTIKEKTIILCNPKTGYCAPLGFNNLYSYFSTTYFNPGDCGLRLQSESNDFNNQSISNHSLSYQYRNFCSYTANAVYKKTYSYYKVVNTDGICSFSLNYLHYFNWGGSNTTHQGFGASFNYKISMYDFNDVQVLNRTEVFYFNNNENYNPYNPPSRNFNQCLKAGIYKIVIEIDERNNFQTGVYSSASGSSNGVVRNSKVSISISNTTNKNYTANEPLSVVNTCIYNTPIPAKDSMYNTIFSPTTNKKMHFSAWVREGCLTSLVAARLTETASSPCLKTNYTGSKVQIQFNDGSNTLAEIKTSGGIIEGWQKVEGDFVIPLTATTMALKFINTTTNVPNYWDDIRVHPYNANMKSYAYDPITLRLSAELDENNYASFYEYDEEGQLIRVKKETAQGIKTIKETRSSKQQGITDVVD